MDGLHHQLNRIELTGLAQLHLIHEAGSDVFLDNAVRASKEGEHIFNEVLFVGI